MARRVDPERIYLARRAGIKGRLEQEAKLSPETAERWLAAWESEPPMRCSTGRTAASWDGAWEWMTEQRRR